MRRALILREKEKTTTQQEFDFEAMAGNKGACKDCARSCQLLHWTKKDLGPIVTRFFKVLIGNDFQEALVIPPNFAETIQDLVDQETVIEDLSGTRWTVTLSHYKDLLAFHKGWSEFFVAFGLQVGDFLVVNYIKGSHFVIHAFGRNGCERVNTATTHQPLKEAARSNETVATESTPCQATRRGAKKRKSSRTSAKTQSTETNCITNSEAEKEKQVCMDKEFYMMVDREAGHSQSDYRTCLFDLSNFEMQKDVCADGKSGKPLDGKEGSSGHAQTVVNFQLDENHTERVVLEKETTINSNIVENNKDLGPIDNMLVEHATDNLPFAVPSEGLADNVDGKSNVATLRKSRKSRKSSIGSSSQNPLSTNRNLNKELKIAEKTKKTSARAHKRALESSAGEEGGNSLESVETINIVKTEPVGSLDVPPPTTDSSFTCLAVPNSSVFIELPSPLPLVLFHKARQGKATMTIEDPQGRDWGCVYHEQLDFRVIIAPWFKINEVNDIRTGDLLKFTMELPCPLPLVLFHKARQGKATMTIEDPQGRDWGCVYHEQLDFRVIIAPWFKINEENDIRTGDLLKFTMVAAEPLFPNKYKFDIVRKQPDN
ncbi:hypothetical protein M9H77_00943 [Catharanthus roseus]|uniref:Uncharacterized protein n=1 Tax=Catharanthus roseus TaxID=4058 RepID=A0ACC0C480_CATRO|nr:hypothetical protein M9H77_00943 [Catharanthus roseus]